MYCLFVFHFITYILHTQKSILDSYKLPIRPIFNLIFNGWVSSVLVWSFLRHQLAAKLGDFGVAKVSCRKNGVKHSVTHTVDGSEIRRSPPGMVLKPVVFKMGETKLNNLNWWVDPGFQTSTGSIGLLYLPTFAIQLNHSCRYGFSLS